MKKGVMAPMEPESPQEIVKRRIEDQKSGWAKNSRIADAQIIAHDTGGYESDRIDFSEFDDGYGNNVAHGDISMQRMVERGEGRQCGYVTPYDLDPYQSRAQQRFMHAAANRGEIPKSTVKEHDKKTDFSGLPERKKR